MKIRVFGAMEEIIGIYPGDDERCVVEVVCDAGRHKIFVDPAGNITLPDHRDDEPMLSDLAGDKPDESDTTCLRVRNSSRSGLEPATSSAKAT
jgi:hypothetical protein